MLYSPKCRRVGRAFCCWKRLDEYYLLPLRYQKPKLTIWVLRAPSARLLRYMSSVGMVQETSDVKYTVTNITRSLAIPGYEAGIRHA